MKRLLFIFQILAVLSLYSTLASARSLEIYFIDVLGGAATLIVTPAGESILIDSGWHTEDHRDAGRICDALETAGLTQIDYSITTHWHRDHYGGIGEVANRVPVRHFYDLGIPESLQEDTTDFPILIERYKKASAGKSSVLNPGDVIPLKQSGEHPEIMVQCMASNRKMIDAKEGLTENPFCEEHVERAPDPTNNANSIAVKLSYGDFQIFCGGDMTWNIEKELVCPVNRVGEVDMYLVNHHGLDSSNNPVLLKSLNPLVAIVNNGPRKGGAPAVIKELKRLPELQALFQLHRNEMTTSEFNTEPSFIANPNPKQSGQYIKAKIADDGSSFIITYGEDERPREFLCK